MSSRLIYAVQYRLQLIRCSRHTITGCRHPQATSKRGDTCNVQRHTDQILRALCVALVIQPSLTA